MGLGKRLFGGGKDTTAATTTTTATTAATTTATDEKIAKNAQNEAKMRKGEKVNCKENKVSKIPRWSLFSKKRFKEEVR